MLSGTTHVSFKWSVICDSLDRHAPELFVSPEFGAWALITFATNETSHLADTRKRQDPGRRIVRLDSLNWRRPTPFGQCGPNRTSAAWLMLRRRAMPGRKRDAPHQLHLLVDEKGRAYQAVFTTKAGRRYRYYVSRRPKEAIEEAAALTVRLPADGVEARVADRLRVFLTSQQALSESLIGPTDEFPVRRRLFKHAKERAASSVDARAFLLDLRSSVRRVVVGSETLTAEIDRPALRSQLHCADEKPIETEDAPEPIVLAIASHLYRTGHDLRMVIADEGTTQSGKRDVKLLRLIARGRRWYEQLTSGEMPSLRAIARAEGLRDTYAARIFAGSLLAPDIVESVLVGRQPVTFTVDSLRTPPPLDWAEQRRAFGFPQSE